MTAMHTLLLDFQNTRRHSGWLNFLYLTSGLIAVALLVVYFLTLQTAIDKLESRRTSIEHQAHHTTRSTHRSAEDEQQLRAEVKDANEVLSQLSLPWVALFKDIEASQQQQVALLAIVPDAPRRVIKISGEARDLSAVLGYLRNLQKAKSLKSVYLQNHQVELRTAEKPVHFTILASWAVTP